MLPVKVLVVEDHADLVLMIRRLLGRQGHECVGSAWTGAQAVHIAQTVPVDLALVDVQLRGDPPQEDAGIRAARRLQRECGVTSLFVTGSGYNVRPGYDGCGVLRKPFTPAVLRLAVDAALRTLREGVAPGELPDGLKLWPPAV